MKLVYTVLLVKENFVTDVATIENYDHAFNLAKKWARIEFTYLTTEELEIELNACHVDGFIWGKNGDCVQVRKNFLWN
jgi:hypothetical protein